AVIADYPEQVIAIPGQRRRPLLFGVRLQLQVRAIRGLDYYGNRAWRLCIKIDGQLLVFLCSDHVLGLLIEAQLTRDRGAVAPTLELNPQRLCLAALRICLGDSEIERDDERQRPARKVEQAQSLQLNFSLRYIPFFRDQKPETTVCDVTTIMTVPHIPLPFDLTDIIAEKAFPGL